MNRYRNVPGQRGPSKATASTLCQKCLQRDIYECKVTAQERPYISRPSRTQQLQNPELVPKLTNDAPKFSAQTDGLADEILAKLEQDRGRKRDFDQNDYLTQQRKDQSPKQARSTSLSSVSVSTISSGRSRSRSPEYRFRDNSPNVENQGKSPLSINRSHHRKRQHSCSSSNDASSSPSPERYQSRNLGRGAERNIRRKRRESSPNERGRQRDSSVRGSWRDKSQSRSRQRSRIARERWSMTPDEQHGTRGRKTEVQRGSSTRRRERSLSPFSKRLALTQAMNMGR